MKERDREIWVGENRFYLGEDDIMYVELAGDYNVENALSLRDAYLKLLRVVEGKVDIFVDNSRSGKPSQEARKIFVDMIFQNDFTNLPDYCLHLRRAIFWGDD